MLTTKLLQRAARLAEQSQAVQVQLTQAFEARYGTTYSAIDCDDLIDILDYNGGHVTLRIADEAMTSCGHPPLKGPHP